MMKNTVSYTSPCRSKKRVRLRFPQGYFLLAFLLASIFTITSFGSEKIFNKESPIGDILSWTTDLPIDFVNNNIQTSNSVENWNLILVNYENPIPENYNINLVEFVGGEKVDERIYDPLIKMLEAAKKENLDEQPIVVSGYRTQAKQQQLFDDKVMEYINEGYSNTDAQELAKQWVSVPGYSEHQIGLAVDINVANYDTYLWLQENSYKYGFIFRYPGNKTNITGVTEEVWHYRYVGVQAATDMYQRGLCLEEYLSCLNLDIE